MMTKDKIMTIYQMYNEHLQKHTEDQYIIGYLAALKDVIEG